jgi:hypothetical protein
VDKLVQLITQKVGISESQARQAITVVVDFMKERMPTQFQGILDRVVSGEDISKEAGDLLGGASKMFGR